MSGFGLKALKKLKEDSIQDLEKRFFYKHIVYANDFAGILKFLELQKTHGVESVRLITEQGIDKQYILNEWKCSLNPLREEAFVNLLTALLPELEIHPSKAPVRFYRDSKYHEFGGRSKSMDLQPGEEQFLNERYNFKWSSLIDDETWNNLDENLQENQSCKILRSVELTESTDLLEKTNFALQTGDFERFECEHLYWNEGPKKFTRMIKKDSKVKLSDTTLEYLHGIAEQAGVSVHFDIEGKAYDDFATLYLPQSVTYEWGHFMGDVSEYNPETNKQEMVFTIMLTDDDNSSEEDLAKKIKLLKRVMERTIPNFSKVRYDEHLRYLPEMYFSGMKDELAAQIKIDHPNLHLIGAWAPMENIEVKESRNFIRSYFSL